MKPIKDAYELPCFWTGEVIGNTCDMKEGRKYKGIKSIFSIIMVIIMMGVTIFSPLSVTAKQRLTKQQQKTADAIAAITDKNWKKYGVLPSVAVGQAYQESSLGKHCANYNLWGIGSGSYRYNSLYDGVIGYMKTINNGYYKGAPGEKDYRKQLKKILAGGYCTPVGDYYRSVMYGYRNHHFEKYDKALFKRLAKEKKARQKEKELEKKEKQREERIIKRMTVPLEPFTVIRDSSIPEGVVYANKECISGGCIMAYQGDAENDFLGIYEVKEDSSLYGNTIRMNFKGSGHKIFCKVYESAVG